MMKTRGKKLGSRNSTNKSSNINRPDKPPEFVFFIKTCTWYCNPNETIITHFSTAHAHRFKPPH